MNLQISTDLKNKKLKINTSEEGIKTIHLDEIKNLDNFAKLDNYIYLGNTKKSSIDSGYIGNIVAVKTRQTNQIYLLKDEVFDNGVAYDDNSYKNLLKWLMLITDKSFTYSVDLIKSTRKDIQKLSTELSLKDIAIYPSRVGWVEELNVNLKLLLIKSNIYPKISDTLVGLIENLDDKLQENLLLRGGIYKKEIDERYFKIHMNGEKVCFTFFDYDNNTNEPIDEKSAIAYLLKYTYSKPNISGILKSKSF